MGYDFRYMGKDTDGNPIIKKYGGTLNEASSIIYDQKISTGVVKQVTTQSKLEDIDNILKNEYIITDNSPAWVSGETNIYKAGETRTYNSKVYQCIITCNGSILPTNTTYWREFTLSELNSKISDEIEPKITPYETDTLGSSAYTSNITYQFNTVEKRGNEVHLCLSASATVDFGSGKSIASIPSKYRKSASYNVNGFIVSNENVTVPIKFNVINGTISQDYTPNARRFFIDTIYFI